MTEYKKRMLQVERLSTPHSHLGDLDRSPSEMIRPYGHTKSVFWYGAPTSCLFVLLLTLRRSPESIHSARKIRLCILEDDQTCAYDQRLEGARVPMPAHSRAHDRCSCQNFRHALLIHAHVRLRHVRLCPGACWRLAYISALWAA